MTVYVDEIKTLPGGLERCRLLGTDLAELRDFAKFKLRISEVYEQLGPPTHYHLRPTQRRVAVQRGAVEISAAELAKKMRGRV